MAKGGIGFGNSFFLRPSAWGTNSDAGPRLQYQSGFEHLDLGPRVFATCGWSLCLWVGPLGVEDKPAGSVLKIQGVEDGVQGVQ